MCTRSVRISPEPERKSLGEAVLIVELDGCEAAPIDEAVEVVVKRFCAVPPQYRAADVHPALQRLSALVYAPLAAVDQTVEVAR